ncbi:MAG TPA: protein norD, partial [Rhodopila sp.]|nr:protein norD [Rhodopila sp.]
MGGLLEFLEPEELVGRHWHRLVASGGSWPRFPEAAVSLEQVQGSLSVFFRGLGGAAGIRIAATGVERSAHRLSFRLRLGLGEESLPRPRLDGVTLLLPERLDVLPETAQNRALYLWLAAFFAHLPPDEYSNPDPLRRDLLFLRQAHRTTQAVLTAAPGLTGTHHMLCQVLRSLRPQRRLPPA